MFDFRYHALSLVAVFLALAVGLLLGVAIGDTGLVSEAEKDVRASLRGDVGKAQDERDAARETLRQRDRFEQLAYPALVAGRIAGMRIALIELGGGSDRMWDLTRNALAGPGAKLVSVVGPCASRSTSGSSPTRRRGRATRSSPTAATCCTRSATRIGSQLVQRRASC